MSRYGKYFLQQIFQLEDDFCIYYVQDDSWGHQEILDVEYVTFDFHEDAQEWMVQCLNWDPHETIRSLRRFLAEDCLTQYMVHRMNDRQVVRTAVGELVMGMCRVVIEPKYGWAVCRVQEFEAPLQSIDVEGAPDIDRMLDALQVELDALVAGQKRSYDEWEAKLSRMSDAEKAALYGKKGGGALFDATIGAGADMIKMSAVQMWKVYTYPKRLADISAEAMLTGSWEPFQREIHSKLSPLVRTTAQAKHFTSMTVVLLGEPATRDMLQDFAVRFWDNTHPVEKAQWGIEAGTELILNLLLLIFTAGVGTTANIAAKSGRLIKLAKLLERVAGVLKRVKSHARLPKLRKGPAGGGPKTKTKPGAKGPEQPKTPEKSTDIDGRDKNGYGNDSDGPKAAPKKKTGETPNTVNPNRVSSTPLELVQQAPGQPKRVAKIKMDHVLDGEVKTHVNNSGKAFKRGVGGHYPKSPNIRVTEVIEKADKNGVVKARIKFRDPETGKWVNKKAPTDLFPDHWTRRQVTQEVKEAFYNSKPISNSMWEGRSPSGVKIRGYYNVPDGSVSTAWPVHGGK